MDFDKALKELIKKAGKAKKLTKTKSKNTQMMILILVI